MIIKKDACIDKTNELLKLITKKCQIKHSSKTINVKVAWVMNSSLISVSLGQGVIK